MKYELLDFLICPSCQKSLKLEVQKEENKEIEEGRLLCRCGEEYPIVKGVPRLLLEPLRISILKTKNAGMTLDKTQRLKEKTAHSFGYQWRTFSNMEEKTWRSDFLEYIYPVNENFFKGKIGMDAGCGFGRHLYYAAQFGAEIIGIDLSIAVEAAYANTKNLPGTHIVQADIYNLPLKNNSFDFVYSIGVIHHLPNLKAGFSKLLPLLKTGGSVFIWVYSSTRNVQNQLLELIRKITTKIPHFALYWICYFIAGTEWLLGLLPYRILTQIPFLRRTLSKIASDRVKGYAASSFQVSHADWFDRLATPIRFYFSQDEVRKWFEEAGLQAIRVSPTGKHGWRGYGIKE